MSQEIAIPAPKREIITVTDPVPLFDTGAFEMMLRIAQRMARASLIPDHLKVFRNARGEIVRPDDKDGEFDPEGTLGNCLMIVNRARSWGMDPIAVAECTSIVHGKPCYEGKLIAAVIETKLGIRLRYEWSGQEGSASFGIKITNPSNEEEYVVGTVGDWKTNQWAPKDYRKRLKYRGDREWCRLWAPALILGVYSDDEMEDLRDDARARRAMPVGPGLSDRLSAGQTSINDERRTAGFSQVNVARDLEEIDPKTGEILSNTPEGRSGTADTAPSTLEGREEKSSDVGVQSASPSTNSRDDSVSSTPQDAQGRPENGAASEPAADAAPTTSPESTAEAEQGAATSNAGGVDEVVTETSTETSTVLKNPAPPAGGESATGGDRPVSQSAPPSQDAETAPGAEPGKGEESTPPDSSPECSAEDLLHFSSSLMKAMQMKTLVKKKDEWFRGIAKFNASSNKKLETIYREHQKRCAGEIDVAECEKRVREIIRG